MGLPCPRCRTALPADARFCGACGAQVPDRGAPAARDPEAPGMDVCAGCGVIAPHQGSSCSVCGADFAEARIRVPPRSDGAVWVAVRCRFQCRSCGHLSPLNHLDMDGTVVCLRCGLSQIFDVEQWEDGLHHAHAVADLSGPDPEGRHPNPRQPIGDVNPFARIGRDRTSAELAQSGLRISDGLVHTRSLRVEASPGHPLCDHCRRPLTVELISQTRSAARCVPCGLSTDYELPARAPKMNASTRAVIAEEQASDRRDAKVDSHGSGGAVAIRCPNCDAPLTVTGTSQIVTCEYCKASSRIPSNTLYQLGFADPQPLVWWLLLSGRSSQRNDLVQAKAERRDPTPASSRPREQPKRPRRRPPHPLNPVLATALPLALLAGIGWYVAGDHLRIWAAGAREVAQELAPGQAGGASASAAPDRPHTPEWNELQGCSCESPPAQLAVDVRESGTDREPKLELSLQLRTDAGSFDLPAVTTGERRLGIGIACGDDRIVLALQKRITAHSLADGGVLWSRPLPKPYRYRGETPRSGLSVYCGAMKQRRDRIRVPRGRRGYFTVDIDDGKPR